MNPNSRFEGGCGGFMVGGGLGLLGGLIGAAHLAPNPHNIGAGILQGVLPVIAAFFGALFGAGLGVLKPIREPWATIGALVATISFGMLFIFDNDLSNFGKGIVCGAVVCIAVYWGARKIRRDHQQDAHLKAEISQLKLDLAELLAREGSQTAASSKETGFKAAVEKPTDH